MLRSGFLWRRGLARFAALALVTAIPVATATTSNTPALADGSCQLHSPSGKVQHVISLVFDNTHFSRDNPNVPSDLEQMPHLLNFIEDNGVMLDNHHTPLISHTGTDILTSLTGLYGDRHGVPVSNSFRYYRPDGKTNTGVSFTYWTDPIYDPSHPDPPTDTTLNMIGQNGLNTPAPWVPFTRAGCDVGQVATANAILENTDYDVGKVFGPDSPQAQEAKDNPDQASADFVGIGVHCAAGDAACSAGNGGVADLLPDEPGGYSGYNALFGNVYTAPVIHPGGPMTDLDGNVIKNGAGYEGFPGFDGMSATVSLSYVAAMQEHGIPITYAYISDAHDDHVNHRAFGPGEAGYVAALKSYDDAFGKFFDRLSADGINASNTLFVITADENDHFVGGPPTPPDCDGVNTPCTYDKIGELNTNLAGLLATEQGITTPFSVHSDDAPTIHIQGNPSPNDPTVRAFERATGKLTAENPITGNTDDLTLFMADPVEENLLHMITVDPKRTPTFTMFGNPDYFFFAGQPNCDSACVVENPAFAWNHGDVTPDITTTWLGMVGPGVQNLGVDSSVWSDHTDIRPTTLDLVGLNDDYSHDGRTLFEVMTPDAIPASLSQHASEVAALAEAYKEIQAPVNELGLDTLALATKGLESDSKGDKTFTNVESRIASIGGRRDVIASQMIAMLEGAEFHGQAIDVKTAKKLVSQAKKLLTEAHALATAIS